MAYTDADGVEWLTCAEVAKLCGWKATATVRSYVKRRHPRGNPFPEPEKRLDGRTILWRRDAVEAWKHRRPGFSGARTDLYHPSASYD